MRRRAPILAASGVAAGALIVTGFAAVAAGAATASVSAPSSTPLSITGYYQMAVDSADGQVFISQGSSGGDSILVTDFSGNVVDSIAEPSPVEGIALSPDGSTLYAALVGSSTVSPAISVISTSSLTQTTALTLPAGYTPGDVAVQSGDLWVSYSANDGYLGGIGYYDLAATSPTLQTPALMSKWGAPPMLAADPSGVGHTLVAARPNTLYTTVAAYDTATVTALGDGQPCDAPLGEYAYVIDVAVVPGGGALIPACDENPAPASHPYSTSDLSQESPSYGSMGAASSVAIASSTGLVAVGAMDSLQIADVYTPDGKQTNEYTAVGNNGELADRGLGVNADGTELFAISEVYSFTGWDYSLNVYPDPGVAPASVTLAAQSATVTVGKPVNLTGTLLVGGSGPSNTSIQITRTGAGQAHTEVTADVEAGKFTSTDYPPAPGTYTYTVSYAVSDSGPFFSASATVTVAKAAPSLSLSVTPTTAAYGAAVKFDAHFESAVGNSPAGTVTVYGETAGSSTKTKIASGQVGGNSTVSGTAHFDKTTTLYAVYPGSADNTAVTVTKTVSVDAKVTASLGGYYGTTSGDRLYHHTARVAVSAVVAPGKKGECVEFQVQKYVKGSWQTVVTTGCATLNASSEATDDLSVSSYAEGVQYRVRADYIRGKDTSNLDADSGFLSFMVKP
jgi:hypothetical protein